MDTKVITVGTGAIWTDNSGQEHAAQITRVVDAKADIVDLVVFRDSAMYFAKRVTHSSAPKANCWSPAGAGSMKVALDAQGRKIARVEKALAKLEKAVKAKSK